MNKIPLEYEIKSPQYHKMCQEVSLPVPRDDEWKGAVLFLFCEDEVILIKRSETVYSHKGQLAFFGGHRDQLTETPKDVAFREFEEESSLSASSLEFLGLLPPTFTRGSFQIIPVLAKTKLTKSELKNKLKSNGEWDLVLSIPTLFFYNLDHWVYGTYHGENRIPPLHFLYFPLVESQFEILSMTHEKFIHKDYLLWGATARMIWNFIRITYKYLP